ncbi:hypothetical protein [Deinococcus radiopugnans]|uniref:Uncharacterized protein n=1 Tax=Deinococcus radiopugnans ATCC 19172 TaxID=585398 RepID=A0ABR6NQD4_9DEIO|nr:hypothetical protein [Deinococcus radiopugnans]MBB6015415.1 hypothetical protein [Deinococcus radiopugnans ATCC 19172]
MIRPLLIAVLLSALFGEHATAQSLPPLPGTPVPGAPLPGSGNPGAPSQTDATVRPLIPDVISLRRPNTAVIFDINAGNYPPTTFPARYLAPVQAFGVFSNAAKPWTVQMEVHSQPDTQGRALPSKQMHYRVNGGPWLDVTGTPQMVFSNVGPSGGWLPLNIEFALDLTGAEAGGSYLFDVAFTALVLP